ncbi:c-type cytochrome biogenesis protein CcmI [Pseudohalocynthiibacter aestuariivivens]|nr:c-type cytochrome biogenesis protein CcmI [Pseudohalocynthiibacter aestuariivivens]QIE44966.1 c-type cytochrome biogenesis protein CcmI [Pseudohalocynthiibacter aestuariivivens]
MIFWILSSALALAVSGAIGMALLRGRAGSTAPAAYDIGVYRDQLREVERDQARGVLTPAEAGRVRTEVSRRILAADAQLQQGGVTGGQPRAAGRVVIALATLVLVGGSLALYWQLGAPGYTDFPREARLAASDAARADRLSQSAAEARALPAPAQAAPSPEFTALMERLRTAMQENPDDPRGLTLLARNEALLGNTQAAIAAQGRLIEVKEASAEADDYAFLADLMVTAADGYVSVEAEAALRAALERNPSHGAARYYLGLYLAQVDRPDTAFRLWQELLTDSAPDSPWVPLVRQGLPDLASMAGVKYQLPPLPDTPGPSAADVEAASDMTAADRMEMIQGMVSQLSERLASEGGTAAEWARLIGAYGVLGETERAAAIWKEANQVFADRPEALEVVRAGAIRAGVTE